MRISVVVVLALGIAFGAAAQNAKKVERGRYLAEEVGKCQECHTPAAENGGLDKTKWMKGKVLEVAPINPIAGWHKTSPDITPSGRLWQRWGGEEAMVKYMMTGLTPKGKPADPPMPAYKLKKEDAEAIVEYLKTLK